MLQFNINDYFKLKFVSVQHLAIMDHTVLLKEGVLVQICIIFVWYNHAEVYCKGNCFTFQNTLWYSTKSGELKLCQSIQDLQTFSNKVPRELGLRFTTLKIEAQQYS